MKTIIIIKSFSEYLKQTCSDSLDGFIFRGVPDAYANPLVPSIGRLKKFQGATPPIRDHASHPFP